MSALIRLMSPDAAVIRAVSTWNELLMSLPLLIGPSAKAAVSSHDHPGG
jgi:hypothetical protein